MGNFIFEASTSQWQELGKVHREMGELGLRATESCHADIARVRCYIEDGTVRPSYILCHKTFSRHDIFSYIEWCKKQLNDYRSWK